MSHTVEFLPAIFFDLEGNFLKLASKERFLISYDKHTNKQDYHCKGKAPQELFFLFTKNVIAVPLDTNNCVIFPFYQKKLFTLKFKEKLFS